MLLHNYERPVNELDKDSENVGSRHTVPATYRFGGIQ